MSILRLCPILLALLPLPGTTHAAGSSFWFVQVTDTHLGDKGSTRNTGWFINRVRTLPVPVDFVVHTGDVFMESIGNTNHVSEAKSLFARLPWPVYYVAGNHDVGGGRRDRVWVRHFGPLAHRFVHKGVGLAFVCTTPAVRQVGGGYDMWAALENQLGALKGRSVILFQHEPPVADFWQNKFRERWQTPDRIRYAALLTANRNIRAVITGHAHRDEQHWITGVPLYIASSISGYWRRQPSFRLWRWDDGRLTYYTIYK